MSRKEAIECSAEILETHCIPAPYSIGDLSKNTGPKRESTALPNLKMTAQESGTGEGCSKGKAQVKRTGNRASRRPPKRFVNKKYRNSNKAHGRPLPNGTATDVVSGDAPKQSSQPTNNTILDNDATATEPLVVATETVDPKSVASTDPVK